MGTVLKICITISSILGFHPRDETAMLVYKTIENGIVSVLNLPREIGFCNIGRAESLNRD